MIVSEIEILRVLGFLVTGSAAPPPAQEVAAPAASAAPETPAAGTPDDERAENSDDRLRVLRSRLDGGRYDIAPSAVADKMVGRAICDQVARLYDI